jgi:hypothetical protein
VPILKDGLDKWELRARFIDALARFRTEQVRDILVDVGNRLLTVRDDDPCLRYVAQGLRGFDRDHDIIRLLERITEDPDIDAVTRRRANETLFYQDGRSMPELTEDEIIFSLAITDERGRPSDWTIIRDNATYVYEEAVTGRRRFGPAVCRALVDSLRHPHTFVGYPVATALGCFDTPVARDALLDLLTKEIVPADVRDACLRALEYQLERTPDPQSRQTHRFLFLHAAQIARHRDATPIADRLTELALGRIHREDGWLVDTNALEVVGPWPSNQPPTIHVTLDDGPPIDPAIEEAVQSLGAVRTGPDLEAKYRFTEIKQDSNGALRLKLARTTWSYSKRFTTALGRNPALIRHRQGGGWIEPVPLGKTMLPGMAVVHCILLTTDDQVIVAQRSSRVGYAPAHWSASFEEQLNERDFDTDIDPFTQAACRGFREEFGGEIAPERVSGLTVVLQTDLLNLGVVMLLRPRMTASDVQECWRKDPQDGWEAQDLKSIPIDSLDLFTATDCTMFTPLHVTSRLRCALLDRWITSR